MIFRDRRGNLKTVGLKSGRFVQIFQGSKVDVIYKKPVFYNGEECYLVFDRIPECTFGSGVYFIKENFMLCKLEENYDSSD